MRTRQLQMKKLKMPGEFEHHSKCWMLWPERRDNWRKNAKPAQEYFSRVANAISEFEPVIMGVSKEQFEHAKTLLNQKVEVMPMKYNDAWMRDVGPTFIKAGKETQAIKWIFNAWGGLEHGLYANWELDSTVPDQICISEKIKKKKASLVLEGGAIVSDGEGTLITSEECLLARNPNKTKEQIEKVLNKLLGISKIIWLKGGLIEDETGGHVDNICSFIKPGEVLLNWTEDKNDVQYTICEESYKILSQSVDAKGRNLKIIKIHQPNPIYRNKTDLEGIVSQPNSKPRILKERLTCSYVNYYKANNAVVFPTFGQPKYDLKATETFRAIFPDNKIVPINAKEIVLGGGGIHCITLQQP